MELSTSVVVMLVPTPKPSNSELFTNRKVAAASDWDGMRKAEAANKQGIEIFIQEVLCVAMSRMGDRNNTRVEQVSDQFKERMYTASKIAELLQSVLEKIAREFERGS